MWYALPVHFLSACQHRFWVFATSLICQRDPVTTTIQCHNHGTSFLPVCHADDGDLLICGNNDNHQLGFVPKELHRSDSLSEGGYSSMSLSTPQRIGALDAFTVHCAAMGSAHAIAVVAEGSLAVWGCNEFGQLGRLTCHAEGEV